MPPSLALLERFKYSKLLVLFSMLLVHPTSKNQPAAAPVSSALAAQIPSTLASLQIPRRSVFSTATTLRAMTFNLKYASEDGDHPWRQRRLLIRNTLRQQQPDLIGTQEGLYHQLSDIRADLPEYDWIGQGREGGLNGEFTAIFYRRDRLEPLAHGVFWLSETPAIAGSRAWGAFIPRMATWVRFRDRLTGETFYHFNTHLDHLSPLARSRGARLIKARIQALAGAQPVIVTGDFNTSQRGGVHETLVSASIGADRLNDSWEDAQVREGQSLSTYHGWSGPRTNNRRIDWILASPGFTCARSRVVLYNEAGNWPSDHFPVISELEWAQ